MPCAFQRDGTPRPSTFTGQVIKSCMFSLLAVLFHMQLVFSEPWTTGIHEEESDKFASCLIRTIVNPADFVNQHYGRCRYVYNLRETHQHLDSLSMNEPR